LLLGYSRQSYYQGINYSQKQALEEDIIISEVLRQRKKQPKLGARKLIIVMNLFLEKSDIKIGRDLLFRLLRSRGLLLTKRKRKSTITTDSRHRYKKYPNLIRDFIPISANQLWVSDITYIRIGDKFAYLSLITDAYSRKIVGFKLHKDLSAKGPLEALKMAFKNHPDHKGLVHHSDRGVQYCCDEYVKLLQDKQVKISMTENGDPLENAIAERVNGILKTELLEEVYADFDKAQLGIAIACSTYNYLRPHSSIDYLKPVDAHQLQGAIPRKWKNYYKPKESRKEETMEK
jgi:putative transposase